MNNIDHSNAHHQVENNGYRVPQKTTRRNKPRVSGICNSSSALNAIQHQAEINTDVISRRTMSAYDLEQYHLNEKIKLYTHYREKMFVISVPTRPFSNNKELNSDLEQKFIQQKLKEYQDFLHQLFQPPSSLLNENPAQVINAVKIEQGTLKNTDSITPRVKSTKNEALKRPQKKIKALKYTNLNKSTFNCIKPNLKKTKESNLNKNTQKNKNQIKRQSSLEDRCIKASDSKMYSTNSKTETSIEKNLMAAQDVFSKIANSEQTPLFQPAYSNSSTEDSFFDYQNTFFLNQISDANKISNSLWIKSGEPEQEDIFLNEALALNFFYS